MHLPKRPLADQHYLRNAEAEDARRVVEVREPPDPHGRLPRFLCLSLAYDYVPATEATTVPIGQKMPDGWWSERWRPREGYRYP